MKSLNNFLNENIKSKFDLIYSEKTSKKNNIYYDVLNKGEKIGIVEFHSIPNNYIEIDRIYLEKNQQKKGFGQKILYDILEYTKSDGLNLYPLDSTPWLKMGMVIIEDKYPELTITKKEFINKNKYKL